MKNSDFSYKLINYEYNFEFYDELTNCILDYEKSAMEEEKIFHTFNEEQRYESALKMIGKFLGVYKTCISHKKLYFKDNEYEDINGDSLDTGELAKKYFKYSNANELTQSLAKNMSEYLSKYIDFFKEKGKIKTSMDDLEFMMNNSDIIMNMYEISFKHIDLCNIQV